MRSFLSKTREAMGVMPAMGVKMEIEEIERTETGESSATPGCLMYQASFRITEPARYAGSGLRDWFVIGTKEDRRAKRAETWERGEAGPGRLNRLLKRAGVPAAEDDEEWMEAAAGQEVCTHMIQRLGRNGDKENRCGLYFRESDPDFVGVGEPLEDPAAQRSGGRAARDRDDAKARKPRARDAEDEAPKATKKAAADDDDADEEDEGEPRRTARTKAKEKRAAKADDDDVDEDEE
jgi:hypothetical protein